MDLLKQCITKINDRYLDVDEAQWFFAEEAARARLQDGLCKKIDEDCIPTDFYYIRNSDSETKTLKIAENVKIEIVTASPEIPIDSEPPYNITYEIFKNIFSPDSKSYYKDVPYWIEINNSLTIVIAEQYIP